MMRNSYTQRRNEQRDRLAAAMVRNAPTCSRAATYTVQLTLILLSYHPSSFRSLRDACFPPRDLIILLGIDSQKQQQ